MGIGEIVPIYLVLDIVNMNSNDTREYDKSKSRRRAILWQCIFATVPLFGILVWLLIKVAIGESRKLTESNVDEADKEVKIHVFLDLQELLYVFLTILYLSMSLLVYVAFFVPQRKLLFKRYADHGKLVFGDVMELKRNSNSNVWDSFCIFLKNVTVRKHNKYFEAVYTVPEDVLDNYSETNIHSSKKLVPGQYKKLIRTVFPWHRERIAFLILPGEPTSGIPKADIELDVSNHGNHYSKGLKYVATFWVLFSLFGAIFTMLHFKDYYTVSKNDDYLQQTNDDIVIELFQEDHVWRNFWVLIGSCVPIVFGFNYIRYLFYYRFLVKSGKRFDGIAQEMVQTNPAGTDVENGPTDTPYVAIS